MMSRKVVAEERALTRLNIEISGFVENHVLHLNKRSENDFVLVCEYPYFSVLIPNLVALRRNFVIL